MKLKMRRYGPVLEPQGEFGAIFNPGAIRFKNKIYLLPRIIKKGYKAKKKGKGFDNYISEIWLAESRDGIKFFSLRPFILPLRKEERYGVEDPRITKLGKNYFITYTALSQPAFSGKGNRINLALCKSFSNSKVEKHGLIGPDIKDKDAVFFPEKINGKIALLHRAGDNIQIIYFKNLNTLKRNYNKKLWGEYLKNLNKYVVLRKKYDWEARKIGAGPPPLKTKLGWLLIYHSVDKNYVYRAGAALLDLKNPQKVIARIPYPILEPQKRYEKQGDTPNVVFPTGAIVKNGELFLYYGAADKRCCLAVCKLKDLLKILISFKESDSRPH